MRNGRPGRTVKCMADCDEVSLLGVGESDRGVCQSPSFRKALIGWRRRAVPAAWFGLGLHV
jgi:hypothetical protein